jgi:hypothetical protein
MQCLRQSFLFRVCLVWLALAPVASAQALAKVETPASVKKQMAVRGQQDQALPAIKIISPKPNEVFRGSNVPLLLQLSGDLKGYHPHKDAETGTGNHIHVILDNGAYEAYYDLKTPLTLSNLTPGQHVIRVFASRPWHESYKNKQAFAMVEFTVNNNQPVAAQRLKVNAGKPLLTYSRPKGEYQGAAADPILIDYWLSNTRLKGQGGKHIVRLTIDETSYFLDQWEPLWIGGWTAGKHTVQLELLNDEGQVVENGGYNSVTREITVIK